ncbi:hypothetical protein [Synergistes jonesii]|nr:hypothetical protein [Synergistes jonesii]
MALNTPPACLLDAAGGAYKKQAARRQPVLIVTFGGEGEIHRAPL